ncbi:MAG: FAD-binding oxidoreductase, partial [Gammaproteobacteria bacterium]|nr:FAD-binding oxidoreductase [Gammaproteobacteria bacterium]
GDSSLSSRLLSSRFFDNFSELNTESMTVRCGSGISLNDILKICIPQGLFLPVLPGTKFVSVGGAIAADVHGKNHHLDGSFCDHLESFRIMLASGELLHCSRSENQDLFHGTCGGMGLTGMVVDATLKLINIKSTSISQQSLVAKNLQESFELLNNSDASKYSVAWLDCLSSGDSLGRSIIYLGEHGKERGKEQEEKLERDQHEILKHRAGRSLSIPFSTPSLLLNKYTMKAFNNTYYTFKVKEKAELNVNYDRYFFPLDGVKNWNRLYGGKGFLQYQFVLPTESAQPGIEKVLEKITSAGKGSFLSVLKKFGEANSNLLSFPKEGFTLTLDFKREKSLFPLLDELDEIVCEHAGRLYLAKDARMSAETFKSGYSKWEEFVELKNKYDPKNVFSSLQSDRIGLTD